MLTACKSESMPLVRRFHAVSLVLLVATSVAVRTGPSKDQPDFGSASAGGQSSKEFRVFATTFNAHNEVYDGSQKFDDLADDLVVGHDREGGEADIIFVGFQEFRDTKYKMGNRMRSERLWRRSASKLMAAIKSEVEVAATAPEHVQLAKEELARALVDFRQKASSELAALHGDGIGYPQQSNLTHDSTVREKLAPIHDWTKSALSSIQELKRKYPSLSYSDDGRNLWKSYEKSVDNARSVESSLLDSLRTMSGQLDTWERQIGDLLYKLVRPAAFGVGHDHVDISMHPQKFDAGKRCAAGNHQDTFLYAFVNPFSKWKITPLPFHSTECIQRDAGSQTNPGCNINNNVGLECGKVVNLMRFKAEHGDTKLNVCGLNTHMSFAGNATTRMTYIANAMREADTAGCDTVFFMGDFNSRVHCEDGGGQQPLPAYERLDDVRQSSLDYILNKFCSNERGQEKCELKDSNLDELNHILNKETLLCYEEYSRPKPGSYYKKEHYWDIHPTPNPVKGMGLQEVAAPNWPPTYKVKRKDKVKDKEGLWKRCLDGEPLCFVNPDKKGKHNPAWTDRILMRSSRDSVSLETTEYSRRNVPFIKSDHTPVISQVTVRVEEGTGR